MKLKLLYIFVTVALLTTLVSCSSCSFRGISPPQILSFTMKWPTIPESQIDAIRQDLDSGRKRLTDVQLGGPTCEFINDASASPRPSINTNGTPDNHDLNFTYSLIGLSFSRNLGSCPTVAGGQNPLPLPNEILIQSDRNLGVNELNKNGNIELTFGRDKFKAIYKEFTLTSLNVSGRVVGARFQMMATNPADHRVLIIVDGTILTPY
jgi:hypothetical protein